MLQRLRVTRRYPILGGQGSLLTFFLRFLYSQSPLLEIQNDETGQGRSEFELFTADARYLVDEFWMNLGYTAHEHLL